VYPVLGPDRFRAEQTKQKRPARGSWVEVSVHEGWLMAFEDGTPVRATLVATGRGEVRADGFVMTSTTPGVFRVLGKYRQESMRDHEAVPFVLSVYGSIALHAAPWHDRWGEKVSTGCVNLAPSDARWLFGWSEPRVPRGWHGAVDGRRATIVWVHP
jgi:hypothetical protein